MKYQSVIGFGKANFVEELDDKRKALDVIMAQYSDKQFEFPENKVKATTVIKVEIGSMKDSRTDFAANNDIFASIWEDTCCCIEPKFDFFPSKRAEFG